MATSESRLGPINPLEALKVPDDVKIRLAELELELSEGKKNALHLSIFIALQTLGAVSLDLEIERRFTTSPY